MVSARALHFPILAGFLAGLLLLAGCAAPPPPPDRSADSADAAFARGDLTLAAELWTQQALATDARAAAALWLNAADAWERADEPSRARAALRPVSRDTLSAGDTARYDMVLAALAIRSGRLDEAEQLLQAASVTLPPASLGRYDELYDRLLQQLAGPGSIAYAEAESRIRAVEQYDPAIALELMRTLERVSSAELAARAHNRNTERQLAGWLELALVIRQNLVETRGIETAIAAWKTQYPGHLLTAGQALDTWLNYRMEFQPPARVAVILPGSGRLSAAGNAIRDGLLSAYADSPGLSELLFFPTDDDPRSPVSAYYSALDAGADHIIGPLRREWVEELLLLPGISTPVLALNDLPESMSEAGSLAAQARAITLSQDEETRSIAAHAAASGLRNAMLLIPESSWGERMAAAFQDEFLQENRQILAVARYPESQNDHSIILKAALKIDESEERKRQLQNTLQIPLEFEPVRRDDVDVIFMAANPVQARQLRPQLKFHDAGDITVYATGRAFSGQPDPLRNRDLDGIRLPAAPWQVEHREEDDIPGFASLRDGSWSALYALGMDAWNLLPWLELLDQDPGFRFAGQSGTFSRGDSGTLRREPAWVVFRNGRPVPLDEP
ncbi:MAG: penicillin-binding protein activator [Xanthomonadales bacterium]|jgi:outer membrane PBP1 activator LpoA protein|nr:penicillin-binding protein activator [Xanthomonadales bacterium]